MEYLQFNFSGTGEDNLRYKCTMFYERSEAPDGSQAIANAQRSYPGFTDIRLKSVITISLSEYSSLVRIMCDCDSWGFQPIS